jgi:hypothetical protein
MTIKNQLIPVINVFSNNNKKRLKKVKVGLFSFSRPESLIINNQKPFLIKMNYGTVL